ncbi:MAG: RNA 2',3'-cyclic phosphodiesterase [Verrucomicrobia bacterium]|nr:RNA 2',3'-cyclic phosphodiesterase [Verrucomicrobiota bacterium]
MKSENCRLPQTRTSSAAIRAFVAVPVPAELKAAIAESQRQLQARAGTKAVRWVSAAQWHLTLKFYGNVDSEKLSGLTNALRAACATAGPFSLSLGGLGSFPSWQKPSVIWIGIGGDLAAMANLEKSIEQRTAVFGSRAEKRDFRPHLTVGRVKGNAHDARQAGQAIRTQHVPELGKWEVREIELIQSLLSPQGSSYRSLAVLPLT